MTSSLIRKKTAKISGNLRKKQKKKKKIFFKNIFVENKKRIWVSESRDQKQTGRREKKVREEYLSKRYSALRKEENKFVLKTFFYDIKYVNKN